MKISDGHKKRAVLYLRRSTDKQEQSIGDQRAELEKYALRHGYEVIREYVDDAISGSTTDGRAGFLQMISDAQQPECAFQYILVYDIRRFGRVDTDEAGYYRFLLKQKGIEVIYTTESFTGNDTDDIVLQVKQWLARQESKDLSKVTIRGQVSSVKEGWWNGGVPPYGYDLEYCDSSGKPYMVVRFLETGEKQVFDTDGHEVRKLAPGEPVSKSKKDKVRLILSSPERVARVRRIFDMYLRQGLGYKGIAQILNMEGALSPRNGAWSRNTGQGWSLGTIRSIIMNPLYIGCMVWNRRASGKFHSICDGRAKERKGIHTNTLIWNDESDWEVIPDTHPAIIDRKTFDEAQMIRKERSVKRGGTAYRAGRARDSVYLLSGLLVCSHCHHHFHGYTITSAKRLKSGERIKTRYYACGGAVSKGRALCERRLVRKEELEADILGRIKVRVDEFLHNNSGADVLKECLAEELEREHRDPRAERRALKKKMADIDNAIDRLLDSLTPTNKEFIDRKLVSLKRDRDQIESELEALEALPSEDVDIGTLADEIIDCMGAFEDIFKEGTLEEKKLFIRLFVTKIELDAGEKRAWVHIRRFPAPQRLVAGNSSFQLVAGARCVHQKIVFPPIDVVELPLKHRGTVLIPLAA